VGRSTFGKLIILISQFPSLCFLCKRIRTSQSKIQGKSDSCRSFVRFYPLVGFPYHMLGNLKRLCLVHRLLPSPVDHFPKLDDTVPLLLPHYRRLNALTGCAVWHCIRRPYKSSFCAFVVQCMVIRGIEWYQKLKALRSAAERTNSYVMENLCILSKPRVP
jgi:hypothetical protein